MQDSEPRLIRLGDTGPAVADLQRRLRRSAEDDVAVSASFDPDTQAAVRAFQRARGLPADGIVGPETWRSLVEAGFVMGDRLLWHSQTPMRGDDVRELQHRLNQLGFDAGPEDGIFGRLAQAAVCEFQRNIGVAVDGVAGPATLEALRRLHRQHQSAGVGARAREREALRHLSVRGMTGARILVDPSRGPADPGSTGTRGVSEAAIVWQIASQLAGRLRALGADVVLARGPGTTPSGTERARLANELAVDVVVSIALNALDTTSAHGASTYYFGRDGFFSSAGQRLAETVQDALVGDGWRPDCRTHPMTWAILRETRMPAVVTEPGFLTSPEDERRLLNPAWQMTLAEALAGALDHFFTGLGSAVPSERGASAPAVEQKPLLAAAAAAAVRGEPARHKT